MKKRNDWAIPHGVIHRDLKIKRRIASGSKTTSYMAEDSSGNKVTVTCVEGARLFDQYKLRASQDGKSLKEAEDEAGKLVERYQHQCREIFERVKGLSHPQVAQMYEVGEDREKNQFLIISEYVPGIDFYYATRGLEPLQMVSLFHQVLEGLQFIHSNMLLHLNIKPAKIRVDLEFEPPSARFIDFGFAVPIEGYEGGYSGTPTYMAPEVILEQRELINSQADLYSFAALVYYCLTGHQPFEHRMGITDRQQLKTVVDREALLSPPSHSNKKVPPELDNLVLGLLQKNPADRPMASAADVLAFLVEKWPSESQEMPHEITTTLTVD